MSNFAVNILGCGSAMPTLRHLPSCQVLDFRDNLMMIDCGEGAQLSMRRQRLKFSRLGHIFLSHLHGDHCLGLPGLISTLSLAAKDGGHLTVHTFKEGAELFGSMLDFFCHDMPFDVRFDVINPDLPVDGAVVWETDALTVRAFPLRHKVPCVGYRFDEKPKLRHIKGDMVSFHQIPRSWMDRLRRGEDYVAPDGRVLPNFMLTTDADPAMSYAYCSDTMYSQSVARSVEGVDTLYHEATYADDLADMAVARGHSTARQAAEIARQAGVNRLVLGHYSKRYPDEDVLLAQARSVFPNTIAAREGMKIELLK